MPFWKRIVRNYFKFNNRERRGVFVLLLLLFVLVLVHGFIRFYPETNSTFSHKLLTEIGVFESNKNVIEFNQHQPIESTSVEWNSFDPNSASLNDLVLTGLDSAVANRVIKYREKGGSYYSLDGLARIYGMNESWLKEAAEYVTFPQRVTESEGESLGDDSARYSKVQSSGTNKTPIIKVELNLADSQSLEKIPWIGPFTAGEIVGLRKKLGGFRSYDQLLDVYRIRDETIESVINHTTLDTGLISRININSCSLRELGRHPYITWKQAKIILNYREQHGPYISTRGILKTSVISDSLYSKIAPYLTVQ